MTHKDRFHHFTGAPPGEGQYILYWMQQAQRINFNHALAYGIEMANKLHLPLVVAFVLTPDFPGANLRHYTFMLEGIADVQKSLGGRGIPFVLKIGGMVETVVELAAAAAWLVTDVGYLRIQRQWRDAVMQQVRCPCTAVETDVTVPVLAASEKAEIGARTLRPKITRQLDAFLDPLELPEYRPAGQRAPFADTAPVDPRALGERVVKSGKIEPVKAFPGGETAAEIRLRRFISENLSSYDRMARDPVAQCVSQLSPYLHFGQISPVRIVRAVRFASVPDAAKAAFIEQLVIRRELAVNFVYHNPDYDRYEKAVPAWARQTFDAHRDDPRPYLYPIEQFEQAQTHDPYWNAAQMEMVKTGHMHNYMRMYWGKKIIEWCRDPEEAYDIMIRLNNAYELDGRDPNGYAGVAWCFGTHDRPWKERDIFGKVRYMNAAGLERKFKIGDYVNRITGLIK